MLSYPQQSVTRVLCACSGESGLKVNGEAAHSQDFLSGGRSILRRARIGTAHAQLKAAAHARTRNRGTMRALRINSARVSLGSSRDDYFRHSRHVSPFFFHGICQRRTLLSLRSFVFRLETRLEGWRLLEGFSIFSFGLLILSFRFFIIF